MSCMDSKSLRLYSGLWRWRKQWGYLIMPAIYRISRWENSRTIIQMVLMIKITTIYWKDSDWTLPFLNIMACRDIVLKVLSLCLVTIVHPCLNSIDNHPNMAACQIFPSWCGLVYVHQLLALLWICLLLSKIHVILQKRIGRNKRECVSDEDHSNRHQLWEDVKEPAQPAS